MVARTEREMGYVLHYLFMVCSLKNFFLTWKIWRKNNVVIFYEYGYNLVKVKNFDFSKHSMFVMQAKQFEKWIGKQGEVLRKKIEWILKLIIWSAQFVMTFAPLEAVKAKILVGWLLWYFLATFLFVQTKTLLGI